MSLTKESKYFMKFIFNLHLMELMRLALAVDRSKRSPDFIFASFPDD